MRNMKNAIYLLGILVGISSSSFGQGGPGMGGQFDPAKMVAAEKQLLLDSITGLNDDQKLIIDQIYKDYEATFAKARESANPDNREAMRENMLRIRGEKTDALQAILTAEQFSHFDKILAERRARARERRGNNRDE